MKVIVIGAGFTGLAAAHRLSQQNHQVVIIEKNPHPGGLASGFSAPGWEWSLEHHYHHIFQNDNHIINLFKQLGLDNLLFFQSTSTGIYVNNHIHPFDNPLDILAFPHLSLLDKARLGVTAQAIKALPFWQPLDKITAKDFIISSMGMNTWNIIWQPLFLGKFDKYSTSVNAAWFWSRIHARTKKLGYIKGGFLAGATAICQKLKQKQVKIFFDTSALDINRHHGLLTVATKTARLQADHVLITSPAPILLKLVKSLPQAYIKKIMQLQYTGAVTLVTESKKPMLEDKTYWLNINKQNPLLAIVDHTNFIDKTHYANRNITYFGKYTQDSKWLNADPNQLIEAYKPVINDINHNFVDSITRSWVFSEKFAQPIPLKNHKNSLPTIATPIKNLWWASIQHVYPWDRGTNYAVELGINAAESIMRTT